MCYARINDSDGTLTKLREKLSMEVEEQIGGGFPIFQDIEDIKWGEDWKERIDESLSEVTFFIPIITPSFFKSKYCRNELNQFLEREKRLERNDLVLPIYYIETPLLEIEREIAEDGDSEREIKILAKTISNRQRIGCADWRKLRQKCRVSFNYVEVYEALEGLAIQIRDALKRLPPIVIKPSVVRATETEESQPQKTQQPKNVSKPKAPIVEIVVDQTHHGDYATISDAIEAANPGDKILVLPGLYQEGLVIDKPLEIIGEGERDEIVVQASGKNALLFKTAIGRVANLTLRQMGGENWYGVDIAQGRLILEDCDISSQGVACIGIHNFADPRLHRNKIHDGKKNGVYVYDSGQGIMKNNDIFGNTYAQVVIKDGGNPYLELNKIHDGNDTGVSVLWNGMGVLTDNDIFGNARHGVWIFSERNPILSGNRINRNGCKAIFILDGGDGIIEGNDLRDNVGGALNISDNSKSHVKLSGNLE